MDAKWAGGFGWQGERLRLVPLDAERHLENAYRWLNDPVVTEWLLVGDHPLTRVAERAYFESDPGRDVRFAIETLDGEHLGFSTLHDVDHRSGTARCGSFLGDPQTWGKGFGTEAALIRARYAFEVLGLRVLYSSFVEGNERSLAMQRKAGYEVCGRLPKRFWKRGAYRDEILTFLSRPEE